MIISFTKLELVYLDDVSAAFLPRRLYQTKEMEDVSPMGVMSHAYTALPMSSILKFGGALLECQGGKTDSVNVDVIESELWWLREIANSTVKYGDENVGINLKLKILQALTDFYNQQAADEVVDFSEEIR